ncbi:MAG: Lar family restriction alleviation protein [Oscillospiraceae bacterium]|nr:Lar family restriction alleviation protein [Oscillospiraceae bacterium]
MDIYQEVNLLECPLCGGSPLLEEELGQGYYVFCMDCGCHSAEVEFRKEEERLSAAKMAAELWNRGKVFTSDPGE